jgi:hypothetical protein
MAPELLAVTVANVAAAAFRFAILRTWVFRPRFGTHLEPAAFDGPVATGHTLHSPSPTSSPPSATDRIPTRTLR